MKNTFKLSCLALAISLSLFACKGNKSGNAADSAKVDSSTSVKTSTDTTIKVDTTKATDTTKCQNGIPLVKLLQNTLSLKKL